jgi:hypothetical protein
MLVGLFNVVKVESVPLKSDIFKLLQLLRGWAK